METLVQIAVTSFSEVPENFTGIAERLFCGTKIWLLNGKYHRTDGPAVEWTNGSEAWYLNGKLHRTDGPAVEYFDGTKKWFLNGIRYYFEEEWQKEIATINESSESVSESSAQSA